MGKIALVTGATGGMGTEIVADLAQTHRVIAVGRRRDALAELAKLDGVTTACGDLRDQGFIDELASGIERLDVLVHAAAIGAHQSLAQADGEAWREQLAANVIAPALLTRATIEALRATRGVIIFIGSGAGTHPVAGSMIYPATKHALKGFADSLRLDEAKNGVRITTIAPGQTDTPMLQAMIDDYHPERYIRPVSIARAVRFVVDAGDDVQLTDVAVRPRVELGR